MPSRAARILATLRGPHGPSTYWLTRVLILRALGFVYLFAFASLLWQLRPLLGADGLTPVARFLSRISPGGADLSLALDLPTIFWAASSDAALLAACALGVVLSALLLLGAANAPLCFALWLLYLSFVNVGQRWFSFGWESQLLETGFLAIFLSPLWRWRPFPAVSPPSTAVILLFRWLIFRIMLGAALIKLRGDECWRDFSCLRFHFETQPIPNPFSWVLQQLPPSVLDGGVVVNHFVELVVPWFLLAPRRVRHVAGFFLVGFQCLLIASGNLAFLNWLTLVPALACFDDQLLVRLFPARLSDKLAALPPRQLDLRQRTPGLVLAALVAWLSIPVVENLWSDDQKMNRSFGAFHLVNTYGAFGSVGRERHELVIEGTLDADPVTAHWSEYELPCKPGDPMRRPCVLGPFHLRLDWLIWFAALESEHAQEPLRESWLVYVVHKLLEGDPGIRALLATDPFGGAAPRFVRVVSYRYAFTRWGEPGWWRRSFEFVYVIPLAKGDPRLLAYLRRYGYLDGDGPAP